MSRKLLKIKYVYSDGSEFTEKQVIAVRVVLEGDALKMVRTQEGHETHDGKGLIVNRLLSEIYNQSNIKPWQKKKNQ